MNSSKTLTSISIVAFLFSTPVMADWKSFLNDITTAGEELLSDNNQANNLDMDTIISGLKEALDIGSRAAIDNVGQPDGYLSNELIHISMPPELQQAGDLMRKFGLSEQADQFENSLNQAAEKAAPHATEIIVSAIKKMSISDANNILTGADDAATQYFKEHTSQALSELFKPTIKDSLNQVGSTKYYNDLANQISSIPLVGENINLDLPEYVTQEALNGLFTMIALEEKKIRENPAARTTDLLKKVFAKN